MAEEEKSGYYYANRFVRIYLASIEQMMGPDAVRVVLERAGLPELVDNYPPDNLAREFDFADFSAIIETIGQMYGLRGERGVGLHAGKLSFESGRQQFATGDLLNLPLQAVPQDIKVRVALKAMASLFDRFSDQQSSVSETDSYFVYRIQNCPLCWQRSSDRPICFNALGILRAGLDWVTQGGEVDIKMAECRAAGGEAGVFHIAKKAA